MNGILLVNKKSNMTSYDVIRYLKKKFANIKIGHAGTLDPLATGLLICLLGSATKLSHMFLSMDKVYEGEIIFNKLYDSLDVTGKLVDEKEVIISEDNLNREILKLNTSYYQAPPLFSAIKKDGKKLLEYIRKGIDVEVDKRLVHIYSFKKTSSLENNEFRFVAHVSKGTYIRSLASDLGNNLSTYGAIKSLNRVKIGSYDLTNSYEIDNINNDSIITYEEIFKNYPKLYLNDYLIKLVKNGIYLDERQTDLDESFIVYNNENRMIALYEPIGEGKYKPVLIF